MQFLNDSLKVAENLLENADRKAKTSLNGLTFIYKTIVKFIDSYVNNRTEVGSDEVIVSSINSTNNA